VLLLALWQIEEIWRSLQNGWLYNLPFGQATANYWLAHDFWFIAIGVSWVLMFLSWVIMFHAEVKK